MGIQVEHQQKPGHILYLEEKDIVLEITDGCRYSGFTHQNPGDKRVIIDNSAMLWTHNFYYILSHCRKQTIEVTQKCYSDPEYLTEIEFPEFMRIDGTSVRAATSEANWKGMYYVRVFGTSEYDEIDQFDYTIKVTEGCDLVNFVLPSFPK